MDHRPLISILSPCYNVEAFLPQCIDSIIKQTYTNLQIVLIDDGSKDATWRVMQDYAARDPRIEIYHQGNQGVASTRNHLLDKIKGEYVLFVDSDDWIEPDTIEFLITKALAHSADIVMCAMVKNDDTPSSDYTEKLYSKDEFIKDFLYHIKIRGQLCNKLVKASLLVGLRFDTSVSYGEDALLCWQFLKHADKIIYSDKQLYHYRMVDSSLSHQSFGEKKLSGHRVWTLLCEETERLYPEYIKIARARFCIETMLLLRDAGHCGYKEMEIVRMLQATVKKNWHCLREVNITTLKMKIYAFLACRSYWLAGKL